eukprot:gene18551-21113_t
MEMLPSEYSTTGMVQLFNFIINRPGDTDRRKLENLASSAIVSMYRAYLAIFANDTLEVSNRCIGKQAHEYICRRYELVRNPLGNAVFRMGDFLNDKTWNGTSYAQAPKQTLNAALSSSTAVSNRSISSSGAESDNDDVVVKGRKNGLKRPHDSRERSQDEESQLQSPPPQQQRSVAKSQEEEKEEDAVSSVQSPVAREEESQEFLQSPPPPPPQQQQQQRSVAKSQEEDAVSSVQSPVAREEE